MEKVVPRRAPLYLPLIRMLELHSGQRVNWAEEQQNFKMSGIRGVLWKEQENLDLIALSGERKVQAALKIPTELSTYIVIQLCARTSKHFLKSGRICSYMHVLTVRGTKGNPAPADKINTWL